MPRPTADEIVTQKHRRAWTQRGGARPNNRMRYAGADEQYMEFDDADSPVRGGSDPIRVHDPRRRGAYRNVGATVDAPDFDSGSISFMNKHGGISWLAGDLTCPNNFYETVGRCKRPDDFLSGWEDIVRIYAGAKANDRSYTGNTAFEDDEGSMTEIEFTFEGGIYD